MIGKKARRKNRKEGKTLTLKVAPIVAFCLAYFVFGFAPMHTEYHYDVKAEQVYDNDHINQSIELQNLTEGEREILYEAFKKSDHFFGSSEVTIEKKQRLETFDGWKVVELQGVYILVAIDGPEEVTRLSGLEPYLVIGALVVFVPMLLVALKGWLFPSNYRQS